MNGKRGKRVLIPARGKKGKKREAAQGGEKEQKMKVAQVKEKKKEKGGITREKTRKGKWENLLRDRASPPPRKENEKEKGGSIA